MHTYLRENAHLLERELSGVYFQVSILRISLVAVWHNQEHSPRLFLPDPQHVCAPKMLHCTVYANQGVWDILFNLKGPNELLHTVP